jgi:Asp-tRNA(Asn)/Glu-tRNA(Gln) amidotransferase A subunit family amidase
MTGTLIDLSLHEMQAGLRSGDFSSEDLVRAFLQRIHEVELRVRAFVTLLEAESICAAS